LRIAFECERYGRIRIGEVKKEKDGGTELWWRVAIARVREGMEAEKTEILVKVLEKILPPKFWH
jgi:hypothetical protein